MGTRGELRIYLGAAPGVGKTYAMLGEAHRRAARGTDVVVGLVETHNRAKTAALLEGLEVLPRRTVGLPRCRADGAGRRRRARPGPAGRAGRRARAHERPRVAARQALAGHRRPARRRDHGAHDGEHPAPGVAQRRDRADHRRAPAGDRPGRAGAPRPAGGARRHHPRGAAAPHGPRQRLRPGEGRRGNGQLLPAAQPHRAAGDGTALARRPGRGRPGAAPGRPAGHRHLGDPRAGRRRADRGTGERDGAAPGRPHRRTDRVGGAVRRARAARRRPRRRPGGGARRAAPAHRGRRRLLPHRRLGPRADGPARLRPRGRRDPARHRDLAAVPPRPAPGREHRGAGRPGLRAHRRAHGHPRRGRPRASGCRAGSAPSRPAGGPRAGPWALLLPLVAVGSGSSGATSSGCPPTSCCSSWPP